VAQGSAWLLSRGVPPRGGWAAGVSRGFEYQASRYAVLGHGRVAPPPRHWVEDRRPFRNTACPAPPIQPAAGARPRPANGRAEGVKRHRLGAGEVDRSLTPSAAHPRPAWAWPRASGLASRGSGGTANMHPGREVRTEQTARFQIEEKVPMLTFHCTGRARTGALALNCRKGIRELILRGRRRFAQPKPCRKAAPETAALCRRIRRLRLRARTWD
jgi:hypothetical protein